MENPRVISIGFEGPNRAGKGTQIELLSNYLDKIDVPHLVIRGDGSRTNEGKHDGDPFSDWWAKTLPLLKKTENKDTEIWNESSNRLARELIVFRDRVLPNIAKTTQKPVAVLLIDRTLLSRTMVPRSQNKQDVSNNLYPAESKIKAEDVCPDIIFNIVVDKETLLSRLDKNDPKYDFRKSLILEKYDWYLDAHKYIPEQLTNRIIEINGSATQEDINQEIIQTLNSRFIELNQQ